MKTLTVFTPTYNRAHTLVRTYESLCRQTCMDFEWLVVDDGSTDGTRELVEGFINERLIPVRYIWKENGGLYTGYNTAYANIETELNVCIDSDDYMPDNAVELIVTAWRERGSERYAGVIGLDYYADGRGAVGGRFPEWMSECYMLDLHIKRIHRNDSKQAMRTDLMKQVSPLVGFAGEKNLNPVYMLWQVCDERPLLVINENLCYVDYDSGDNMSSAIFRQYADSPRSFAKARLIEMSLKRSTWINNFRLSVHYVSSCLFSRDGSWLRNTPHKIMAIAVSPLGFLLYLFIRCKNRMRRV